MFERRSPIDARPRPVLEHDGVHDPRRDDATKLPSEKRRVLGGASKENLLRRGTSPPGAGGATRDGDDVE